MTEDVRARPSGAAGLCEVLAGLLEHRAFVPSVIAFGLLLRLAISLLFPVEAASDGAWYLQRASEIVAGLGYQEAGFPTAYWPVGYPAILAAFVAVLGAGPLAWVSLNLIAAAIVMLMIVWFGRAAAGNDLAGRLALLAYAVYPNHAVQIGQPLSEGVYTALFMLAFGALISFRHRLGGLLLCGLLFGVATLVKPQTLLFPLGGVIALWWIFRDFRWTHLLRTYVLVYLGMMLVILPWSARNTTVFGEFVLISTNGGVALFIGANDLVTGDHFDIEKTPLMEQIPVPWADRVERQVELGQAFRQAAVDWIKADPARYVGWMPRKIILMWQKDTDGFWALSDQYPGAQGFIRLLQWGNQGYYMLIWLLALPCAWLALRGLWRFDEPRAQLGLLFCMPVFITLLAAVFTGQIRYHYPAMPMLMLAASWSVVHFARRHGAR